MRLTGPPAPTVIDPDVCDTAVRRLRSTYDEARGGFGGAPKFPPSMVLEFLRTPPRPHGSADALAMVTGTAHAMAAEASTTRFPGGGFARYSVDADWAVPHFEKMLYDNALLLRVYAHLWRARPVTTCPLRVAHETADFLLRDLRTDQGAFASALDADTVVDGHRTKVLDLRVDPGAARRGARPTQSARPARRHRERDLRGRVVHPSAARGPRRPPGGGHRWARPAGCARHPPAAEPGRQGGDGLERPGHRPGRCWCPARPSRPRHGGRGCRRPRPRQLHDVPASDSAHDGDRMLRTSRAGRTALLGSPDDHANLAEGLLALHQATGEPRWGEAAASLLDRALDRLSTRTAPCTTPPTTRPPCSPGRRTAPTTPNRAGRQPWPARCSPMARSPGPPRTCRRRGRARRLRPGRRAGPALCRLGAGGRRGERCRSAPGRGRRRGLPRRRRCCGRRASTSRPRRHARDAGRPRPRALRRPALVDDGPAAYVSGLRLRSPGHRYRGPRRGAQITMSP